LTPNLTTAAYVGATILFILSLGGLSNPETSRRGNLYGIIGMTIAVLATVFGPRVGAAGIPWIVGAMVAGGAVGLYAARTVQMTQMPELVALMRRQLSSRISQCSCWAASSATWSSGTLPPRFTRR